MAAFSGRCTRVIAVIPAYNEATTIATVVAEAVELVSEVVVVDDGSSDSTGVRAAKAGALVCRHMLNLGPGAATATGIACALRLKAEIVVTLDADGQHAALEIPTLIDPILSDQADLVVGSRLLLPEGMPATRQVANRVANLITWALYGVNVSDSQSGFKAMTREVAAALRLPRGFEFCSQMLAAADKLGFRLAEVPVKAIYTPYSLSKGQGFGTGLKTFGRMLFRHGSSEPR